MSDLESWIVRATVGALIAALAGIFVRLRVLESKRAAADVRIGQQSVLAREPQHVLQVPAHAFRRELDVALVGQRLDGQLP